MKTLNVGIVGCTFMGKAHSNAWMKAPLFFDMAVKPVRKVACGRHQDSLSAFADRRGWQQTENDWKKMVKRDDVDIVDISAPQYLHHEIADWWPPGHVIGCEHEFVHAVVDFCDAGLRPAETGKVVELA
jgi:predicted dehydrogenase